MTKKDFFTRLEKGMKGVPREYKQEILSDFEHHFDDAEADGRTEDEICSSLGNPTMIGKASRVEFLVKEAETRKSTKNVFRAILAAAGLSLVNVLFVLAPFVSVWTVITSIWAVAAGLALGGVGSIVGMIFSSFLRSYLGGTISSVLFMVFSGIGISALGVLLGFGMYYVTRWFYRVTLSYIKINISIIKKEVVNE